jgi:hypothetical protein
VSKIYEYTLGTVPKEIWVDQMYTPNNSDMGFTLPLNEVLDKPQGRVIFKSPKRKQNVTAG